MLKSFALIWHDLVSLSGAARKVHWRRSTRGHAKMCGKVQRAEVSSETRGPSGGVARTVLVSRNGLATRRRRGASRKRLRKLWRPGPRNWGYWRERKHPALSGSPEEVSRPCSDIRKSIVLTGCNWNVGTGTQKTSGREAAIDRSIGREIRRRRRADQLYSVSGTRSRSLGKLESRFLLSLARIATFLDKASRVSSRGSRKKEFQVVAAWFRRQKAKVVCLRGWAVGTSFQGQPPWNLFFTVFLG